MRPFVAFPRLAAEERPLRGIGDRFGLSLGPNRRQFFGGDPVAVRPRFPGQVELVFRVGKNIALPLARPGIVVSAILSFITSWNNFIFGAVFAGRTTRTMPVAVYNMLTFESFAWGPLAAAAIVVMLPVILLTIVIQKEIVQGLASGGVK